MLGEGECFGETAILTGAPRNATVTCGTPTCQVVSMKRDDFLRLMSRSTVLHADMKRLSSRRSTSEPTQVDEEDDRILQKSRQR